MPLFPPILRHSKGISLPNKKAGAFGSHPSTNQRAGTVGQPALLTRASRIINSETKTIASTGTATLPGLMYTLPDNTDYNALELALTVNDSTTVASGNTVDITTFIDHIEINGPTGKPYARIPGSTFLYDYFVRYAYPRYPTPTTAPANTIAMTTATSVTANIYLPMNILRGSQITFWYAASSTLGTTLSTNMTVTNQIIVYPGDPIQNVSRINGPQGGGLLNSTSNVYLQNNAIPQARAVSELFIRSLGALTNVNTISITTANGVIENNTPESTFARRMTQHYYNAFASGSTLILDEPTTFGIDKNAEFIINMNTAAANATLNWVWYEPAANYL